jgi:hypothetical protein
VCERGKLLTGRLRGVDGESAGRKTVQKPLGHGPEVARALEDQKFVPDLVRIDPATHAETRQRQGHLAQLGRERRRHLIHRGRRDQVLGHAVADGRDSDRGLLIGVRAQQLEPERQLFGAPDVGVGVEANAAVLLRAQFIQSGGQAVVLRRVGSGGPVLGVSQQGVESEGIRDRRRRVRSGRICGARNGDCQGERESQQ